MPLNIIDAIMLHITGNITGERAPCSAYEIESVTFLVRGKKIHHHNHGFMINCKKHHLTGKEMDRKRGLCHRE